MAIRRAAAVVLGLSTCWLLLIASTRAELTDPAGAFEALRRPDNPGPVIRSIALKVAGVATDRAEVGQDIAVTTEISDSKTAVAHLVYDWKPPVGEIVGTGPSVIWRISKGTMTPVSPVLTLDLIEQVPDFETGLPPVAREHTTSGIAPVIHVNDSVAELTRMTKTFLVDYFGNANVSPEACLVDFSDTCRGKEDELEDIRLNRRDYQIHRVTAEVTKIEFHPSRNAAYITAKCTFYDFDRAKGSEHIASGECELTAVYDKPRWWLCDSHTAKSNDTQKYFDTPSTRPRPGSSVR